MAKSTKRKSAAGAGAQRRILNCLPSRAPERDYRLEHAAAAGVVRSIAIPASKDLRESWWEIGDQGQTGSCVGWATADGLLRWHMVKAGQLAKTDHLSVRFQWMSAKETDVIVTQPETFIEAAGTTIKAALDIARKYGTVTDAMLPFGSGALYQGDEKTFYATASRRKIANYINLGTDLNNWRQWLANNGPIAVRLDVDTTWDNAKQTGGRLDVYDAAHTRGGHAVDLVGYDASMFIVRNSWGTTQWGDKGFAYASNAYAKAAFTEAYGISV